MRALRRLLLLALTAGAGFLISSSGACRRDEFRLAGTVTLTSSLISRAPKDNSVLFVVVKNRGGVPVALKRIVNPHFPVRFALDAADLLVPELRDSGGLLVDVHMNTHGSVGSIRAGDLLGAHPDPVQPGDRRVHIVIDRIAP